jgi:hypothetical protein
MPEQVRESMGSGLSGIIDGKRVSAGSRDLIFAHRQTAEWALRAMRRGSWRSALVVFVAVEDRPVGALLLADELRSETPHAIRMLRKAGIARIVMVTGDRAAAAQAIGAALDLDSVLADRVPSDKADAVRAEQRLHPTIMVGDGSVCPVARILKEVPPTSTTNTFLAEAVFATRARFCRPGRRLAACRDLAFTALARSLEHGRFGADHTHQVVPGIDE